MQPDRANCGDIVEIYPKSLIVAILNLNEKLNMRDPQGESTVRWWCFNRFRRVRNRENGGGFT